MQNSSTDPFVSKFTSLSNTILMIRRVQLSMGCLVLLFIILMIIKKKQYIYNTTKLFMWCCVFYLLGMGVVLAHMPSLSSGLMFLYDSVQENGAPPYDQSYLFFNALNTIKQDTVAWLLCGLQAFFNLLCYNIGYLFAILVTYNVHCVLNDQYKNFMRKIFKDPKIKIFLIIMLLIYLVPLGLMYVDQFNSTDYFYSYGPTGFKMQTSVDCVKSSQNNVEQCWRDAELLLYCGMCSNPDESWSQFLSILNFYLCQLIMLILHMALLYNNQRTISQLSLNTQYLNSKQQFLINSGRISVVVFIIQLLNTIKLLLSFIISHFYLTLLVLNFIFDLYPIVLFGFYWFYTQERKIQAIASTMLEDSQGAD